MYQGAFNEHVGSEYHMPMVYRIKPRKTVSVPLSPVFCDESTIEGNISIHEDIEERQLRGDTEATPRRHRGDTEAEIWAEILKPYYGDLKTINRILAVQSIRKTAERPFDSRKWILPGLGLWHLRLNLLRLIHKIHGGGSYPEDSSTLQFAADAWDRSNVHTSNDFVKLEALLKHSYEARIVSLVLYLGAAKVQKGHKQATRWLRHQWKVQYRGLLNSLYTLLYPTSIQHASEEPVLNEVFENHIRFVRYMSVYQLLRFANKFGDVGLIRQALQECCIMFQAKEGGTFQYGLEPLRLLHLYNSRDASDVGLQEAMLVNSLVNLSGGNGTFFEVDGLLEFLNHTIKDAMRARKNSTKPVDELILQIALTSPYMFRLRLEMHSYTGRQYHGKHPEKDASEDIQLMAWTILKRDLSRRNIEIFSNWVAADLIGSGLANRSENVGKYNAKAAKGDTHGKWKPLVKRTLIAFNRMSRRKERLRQRKH